MKKENLRRLHALLLALGMISGMGVASSCDNSSKEPTVETPAIYDYDDVEYNSTVFYVQPQEVINDDGTVEYYAPNGYTLTHDEDGNVICKKEVKTYNIN